MIPSKRAPTPKPTSLIVSVTLPDFGNSDVGVA